MHLRPGIHKFYHDEDLRHRKSPFFMVERVLGITSEEYEQAEVAVQHAKEATASGNTLLQTRARTAQPEGVESVLSQLQTLFSAKATGADAQDVDFEGTQVLVKPTFNVFTGDE